MKIVTNPIPAFLLDELHSLPNQGGLRSIINKTCVGYIFSNEPDHYIFLKSTGPYCYFAGELDEGELIAFIQFLNTFPEISLVCDERHHGRLIQQGMHLSPRIELINKNPSVYVDPPAPIIIKEISTPDFGKKCPWYNFITELFGSEEIFFREGFGVAVCHDDTVLSAAYTACIGDNYCEIGIATNPGHEGKGMATLAIKACLQECYKRELIPEWSCHAQNHASLRVALKTGFVINDITDFWDLAKFFSAVKK